MVTKSFSATSRSVACSATRRRPTGGFEAARDAADAEDVCSSGPSCAHGNRRRLAHLKTKSLTRPISPITMMPKMIWSVASSAWLSVIMWPMPLDAPISSATIT